MLDLKVLEKALEENLCTYFILPVIGVNKLQFGGHDNFLNSYLSKDLHYIYVKVKDQKLIPANVKCTENFNGITAEGLLQFKIPEEWLEHTKLFAEGKYSKFSKKAKRLIIEGSTLMHEKYYGSVAVTDYRLLALKNSNNVREMWSSLIYDEYDARYRNALGEELLSAPTEDTFI